MLPGGGGARHQRRKLWFEQGLTHVFVLQADVASSPCRWFVAIVVKRLRNRCETIVKLLRWILLTVNSCKCNDAVGAYTNLIG